MKPSWTNERRNEPVTDKKFRTDDEHLAAENKEEVAKSHHGDKLAPDYRQEPGSDNDEEEQRATAP